MSVVRPGRRSALASLAAAALVAAAPARAAVDPFYTSRLQDGIVAAERGAHLDAVKSLRIACFGMLDEEPQLADCLVRLALAQAGAGDREGFAQTFQRLVEGEELIGLYSKAGLGADLTAPFEAKLVEWVPRAAIAASPAFERLAVDQREAQLAALAPKARRERLAKLEKEEPKSARWPLLLGRLEREQRDPKAALAAAGRALAIDAELEEARCLRGWARAATGKYADAVGDLTACHHHDPAFTAAELQSRVELQQWSEADAVLARMTVEQKQYPGVADLVRRVEREVARQSPSQPPRSAAPAPATPPEAAPVATVAPRTNEPRQQTVPAQPAGGTNHRAAGGGNAQGSSAPATPPRPPATATATAAKPPAAGNAAPPATAAAPPVASVGGGPPGGALPSADETTLARAQSLLSRARTAAEIEQAYDVASELAARYPSHPRVQHTTAEIAYRASRWSDAVRYFRRGGDPGEAQPLLLFYYAVSLWESGNRQEAAAVMRRCDGKLRPTPFVQAYRDKILGAPTGS